MRTAQTWEIGEWVKVGFLTLRVTAKEPTPGDYMPDAYHPAYVESAWQEWW